jgi:anti-sigma regulatory factor (Ser/Thr protein kinase)
VRRGDLATRQPEVLVTDLPSADAHGPAPLRIRLPAIPASLGVVRDHLRSWLPAASVTPHVAAELLLAVGEATANAVEHAVRGAAHAVELEVTALATDTGLTLTVKDNGRWHAPPLNTRGRRGHGSKVMRALVDTVTITPTPQGTTVEMRKELR